MLPVKAWYHLEFVVLVRASYADTLAELLVTNSGLAIILNVLDLKPRRGKKSSFMTAVRQTAGIATNWFLCRLATLKPLEKSLSVRPTLLFRAAELWLLKFSSSAVAVLPRTSCRHSFPSTILVNTCVVRATCQPCAPFLNLNTLFILKQSS